MKEAKESKVNVRDTKYVQSSDSSCCVLYVSHGYRRAIFLALLMYIYTGQLFITSDSVVDLLRAADMCAFAPLNCHPALTAITGIAWST